MTAASKMIAFDTTINRVLWRTVDFIRIYIFYWLWSVPVWILIGILYETTSSTSFLSVGDLVIVALSYWIGSGIYALLMSYLFLSEVLVKHVTNFDSGFALWRLGLMVPGLMLVAISVIDTFRRRRLLKGWQFAVLTALLSIAARTGSGLLTPKGYL